MRDDLEVQVTKRATLRAGTDMQFIYSKFEFNIPGFGETEPGSFPNPAADGLNDDGGFAVSYPAFWTELEIKPIERLMLLPGVRADYYSNNTQTTVSPRFSTRFQATDQVAVKGGIGLFELVARETLILLPLAAIDRSTATAYVTVVHAVLLLPMIVLGQVFLLSGSVSLRRLWQAGGSLTKETEKSRLDTSDIEAPL